MTNSEVETQSEVQTWDRISVQIYVRSCSGILPD